MQYIPLSLFLYIPTMASIDVNCVMPWVKPKNDGYAEAIKWQQDNARYKIHSWILEDMDMKTLLPH
jgi:hypothetical protein